MDTVHYVCGIIAMMIAALGTLGALIRLCQKVSKHSVKNHKKKLFSFIIRLIGLFSALLACVGLTFPAVFGSPVIFGGAQIMTNEAARVFLHICRAVHYGTITSQCLLQSYFVYTFPKEDMTPKDVKLRHCLFIIGKIVTGAVVAGLLFFTTELREVDNYYVLESVNNSVFIPLLLCSATLLVFVVLMIRFYFESVLDMYEAETIKFLFHIILAELLIASTVIVVLADIWMILFREALGYPGQLTHAILPIPVTLFAFIHSIRHVLTSTWRANCLKLCPCLAVQNQVEPTTVQQGSITY